MLDSIKEILLGLLVILSPIGAPVDPIAAAPQLILPASPQCIALTGSYLAVGSTGPEVKELQKILNITPDTRIALSGAGSPGSETEYFGAMTKAAVIAFQEKHRTEILVPAGLSSGSGIVGQNTRAKVRKICDAVIASHLTQSDLVVTTKTTVPTNTTVPAGVVTPASTVKVSTPTSTASIQQPLTTSSVQTTYSGVCGTVVDTCAVGTYRSRTDSTTYYQWACMGSSNKRTVSCAIPKVTPPVVATTTAPVVTPVSTKPVTPTTTTTTPPPVTTTTALEWGAFSGYSSSDPSALESLVGKPVKLRSIFTNWGEAFPVSVGTDLKPSNKTLVIFWEQYGVTIDSIIAGDSDPYIRQFALDAKAYGGQVILAPFHEMNGNWDPWDGTVGQNTPQKVVLAWQHVRDVFGTVANVKFAWAVNNESVPNTTANAISAYYPGDAYVDYVAVDGFNFGNPWQSFDTVFGKALNTVSAYRKPIYILSMASAAGTQKPAWITDAVTVQMKKYPLLKGWLWFNENKEQDWRINSDAATLSAFKGVLQYYIKCYIILATRGDLCSFSYDLIR
jgi:peptidoglycan hydrolase-like protein with peptidoglycan-binding domain